MKRGQQTIILVIVMLVLAVAGIVLLYKPAGQAIRAPEYAPAPYEPVAPAPIPATEYEQPAPVPQYEPVTAPVTPPVEGPCVASYSARTCYAATALAQKQCLPKTKCRTTIIGPSYKGCTITVECT